MHTTPRLSVEQEMADRRTFVLLVLDWWEPSWASHLFRGFPTYNCFASRSIHNDFKLEVDSPSPRPGPRHA